MANKDTPVQIGNYVLVLGLILLAFGLRFQYLLARVFHIDEYISMLAAQMTAERGLPVFPSGLFYGHGLLVSYLAAPFLRFLGFSEEIARWPSLLVGTLSVVAFYVGGLRLFKSWAAGLFSLAFATLDVTMILWSARMRMYALAGLLMLLALYFLAEGTFLNPQPRYRLAAVACYLGATLSHSVAVVVLPVWSLATLVTIGLGYRRFKSHVYHHKTVRIEILIMLLLIFFGVVFSMARQIPFLSPGSDAGEGGGGILAVLTKFMDPGLSWERVDDFLYYYTSPGYWPLMALGGLAFLQAIVSMVRGRLSRRDLVTLFLGLVFWLTIAELGLALSHTWRKTRYLFILCQAPFVLLAADGLGRLGKLLSPLFQKRAVSLGQTGAILGVIAILAFWGSPALDLAAVEGTGGYDTAFMWVEKHWQPGDRVMTVHPSAAYLYLHQSDYYATQTTARTLIDDESEEVIDRYVGSTLLDSVDALNRALADTGRLWFVVDISRLFSRYEPLFIQQVFAQMDVAYRGGDVLVFLSRPYPRSVPAEPSFAVDANFADLIRLGGYSLDLSSIAPDGTIQLGLYWQPVTAQLSSPYKVFVQLRNDQDQIVAQADHYIYEGFLTASVLAEAGERGEPLRDTADLTLPPEMPSGTYRLLVGLYDPETFERVPVAGDRSGENAVLLQTVTVP
jgi:hypothetical protein